MKESEYIQQRLGAQIKWYDTKSIENQRCFKLFRTLEIICASLIPLISGFADEIPYSNVIVGLLGVFIAISAGLIGLNKYQENWLTYRTTCESLTHEKNLFLTKTKPYDESNAFNELVIRVESLISKENSVWAKNSKSKHAPQINNDDK